MSNKILCDRGSEKELKKVIEEEKSQWVTDVLIALGIDADLIENPDYEDALKEYLDIREIEVWRDITKGTVDIKRASKVVAHWSPPDLVTIKEAPNKWYYEMHLNEWALPFQFNERGEE